MSRSSRFSSSKSSRSCFLRLSRFPEMWQPEQIGPLVHEGDGEQLEGLSILLVPGPALVCVMQGPQSEPEIVPLRDEVGHGDATRGRTGRASRLGATDTG